MRHGSMPTEPQVVHCIDTSCCRPGVGQSTREGVREGGWQSQLESAGNGAPGEDWITGGPSGI